MIRATFEVKLAGEPAAIEQAIVAIGDELSDAGFMYDEDYEALYGNAWATTGVRFHTVKSLQFFLSNVLQQITELYAVQVA